MRPSTPERRSTGRTASDRPRQCDEHYPSCQSSIVANDVLLRRTSFSRDFRGRQSLVDSNLQKNSICAYFGNSCHIEAVEFIKKRSNVRCLCE